MGDSPSSWDDIFEGTLFAGLFDGTTSADHVLVTTAINNKANWRLKTLKDTQQSTNTHFKFDCGFFLSGQNKIEKKKKKLQNLK